MCRIEIGLHEGCTGSTETDDVWRSRVLNPNRRGCIKQANEIKYVIFDEGKNDEDILDD